MGRLCRLGNPLTPSPLLVHLPAGARAAPATGHVQGAGRGPGLLWCILLLHLLLGAISSAMHRAALAAGCPSLAALAAHLSPQDLARLAAVEPAGVGFPCGQPWPRRVGAVLAHPGATFSPLHALRVWGTSPC